MDGVAIRLDRHLFTDEVVARTAHRYTDCFFVDVALQNNHVDIILAPKAGQVAPDDLRECFLNDALDERLREIVRLETAELHRELIRAALREATPTKVRLP